MNIKKVSVTVFSLQIILMLLYFTGLLASVNPPNYILFSVWFTTGIAGFLTAGMLIARRKYLPLALGMGVLGMVMVVMGGVMRLFLTM